MHWLNEESARKFHARTEAKRAEEREKAAAEERPPAFEVAVCPVCRTPITQMLKARRMGASCNSAAVTATATHTTAGTDMAR